MTPEEDAKRYDAAWAGYETEIAELRKKHREAYDLAIRRYRESKVEADKAFGAASQRAWQKFREATGHGDAPS